MDPVAILRVLWAYRRLSIPILVLTILAAGWAVAFGPRTYQSTSTYVLLTPKVPTAEELENNSRLAKLNSDNPYLRSVDPSLIVQVLAARLTSDAVSDKVKSLNLGPEYTAERSANNGMLLIITGYGDTPERASSTTEWLTAQMKSDLYQIQKVNGADDTYLFTAVPVDVMLDAKEKVSSRLRSVVVILAAGVIMMLGVVSLANGLSRSPGSAGSLARRLLSSRGGSDDLPSSDDEATWLAHPGAPARASAPKRRWDSEPDDPGHAGNAADGTSGSARRADVLLDHRSGRRIRGSNATVG